MPFVFGDCVASAKVFAVLMVIFYTLPFAFI